MTTAFPHGGSVVAELKEVLKRRGRKIEQFQYYRNVFGGLIKDFMEKFNVDEETVLNAIFASKFALSELRKTELNAQTRVTEVTHIRMVLESLLDSKKYLPIALDDLVALIQITTEVANQIERYFVENWRLHVPEDVIHVNIVDLYVKPLFEFYNEYCDPDINFRWIMAELEGALRNSFPKNQYSEIIEIYPALTLNSENYMDAGLFIIERYFAWYHLDAVKRGFISQTRSIEEPKYMFGTVLFLDEDQNLIDQPNFTRNINSTFLTSVRTAIQSIAKIDKVFERKVEYSLRFAKYRLRFREQNQMLPERTMFITKTHCTDQNKTVLTAMVLPAEDINVQYVSDTSMIRCLDLMGEFSRVKNRQNPDEFLSTILTKWVRTLNYNTINYSDSLDTVDAFRDAAGLPIAAVAQEMNGTSTEYVLGRFELETFNQITDMLDYISNSNHDFIIACLRGIESEITELELIPWEFVLEHRENKGELLLNQFANDEKRLIGIMTHVEPEKLQVDPQRLLKRRVIQSKAGQILSQKRIDSLQDALNKKMQGEIRVSEFGDLSKTFYKTSTISPLKKPELVSEIAVEDLQKRQIARQTFFEEKMVQYVYDEILLRIGEIFNHLIHHKGGVSQEGLPELTQSIVEERKRLDSLEFLEKIPEELSRGVRVIIEDILEDLRGKLFDKVEILKTLSDMCQQLNEDDFQNIIKNTSE